MNILDLELFDQTATKLHDELKKLDKFYPNDKSLANYLELMADQPVQEWKRFEPIKSESERIILQNVSHLAALLISCQANLYDQYLQLSVGVTELIDKTNKQDYEIKRLRTHCKFLQESYQDSYESEKAIIELVLEKKF